MNKFLSCVLVCAVSLFAGCTSFQRGLHLWSADAPLAQAFMYRDGGQSVSYAFTAGRGDPDDTVVFVYGGSGCSSWKAVMPGYLEGLNLDARVFVLNKRFVDDRSTGWLACGRSFDEINVPQQWVADYSEFIDRSLAQLNKPPKRVLLIGVSEGVWPAVLVAGQERRVTHLAILGAGGYTMRQSLQTLEKQGHLPFDVEKAWSRISLDPQSVDERWLGHPYRYWSTVMDLDVMPQWLSLDIPILVAIGEKDRSVPVESARFLQSRFEMTSKKNLQLMVVPEADHRLMRGGQAYRAYFFKAVGEMVQTSP